MLIHASETLEVLVSEMPVPCVASVPVLFWMVPPDPAEPLPVTVRPPALPVLLSVMPMFVPPLEEMERKVIPAAPMLLFVTLSAAPAPVLMALTPVASTVPPPPDSEMPPPTDAVLLTEMVFSRRLPIFALPTLRMADTVVFEKLTPWSWSFCARTTPDVAMTGAVPPVEGSGSESGAGVMPVMAAMLAGAPWPMSIWLFSRSEEHTSELQSRQ